MTIQKKVIEKIIGVEGDYVNDPDDSGMETRYGITVRVARAHGYTGLMSQLPYKMAYAIIKVDYWDKMRLDDIEHLSKLVAEEIADTAVNTGTRQAGEFLQTALNCFNNRQKYYNDLKVDGLIGIRTLHALKTYLMVRKSDQGERVLHTLLNCLQGAFYAKLTINREKDEKFIYGWIKNRVGIYDV